MGAWPTVLSHPYLSSPAERACSLPIDHCMNGKLDVRFCYEFADSQLLWNNDSRYSDNWQLNHLQHLSCICKIQRRGGSTNNGWGVRTGSNILSNRLYTFANVLKLAYHYIPDSLYRTSACDQLIMLNPPKITYSAYLDIASPALWFWIFIAGTTSEELRLFGKLGVGEYDLANASRDKAQVDNINVVKFVGNQLENFVSWVFKQKR